MKINLLIVSPYVPYDNVGHAGGKTHNYYLKKFSFDKSFNIKLITFGEESEKSKIDLDKYKIDYELQYYSKKLYKRLYRLIFNINSKFNLFNENGGLLSGYLRKTIIKRLTKSKKQGYNPDVILFEWTECLLIIKDIKNIYPNAKYIASEHDVTFLKFKRIYENNRSILYKIKDYIKFRNILKSELKSLNMCDFIVTHNYKDKNLLIQNSVNKEKVDYICPYFENMGSLKPDFRNKNIIFFGAMNRIENYECCIWFVENVFNKLLLLDNGYKFYIIGGNPPEKLKKYSNENIIITGFIDDIKLYFQHALCMVVPLMLGAGIKVKVLEAMSSGIPVLTNEIGIEGIPAIDGEEFIYCKTSEDYINNIQKVCNNVQYAKAISTNARNLLNKNFNLEKSYNKYRNNILKLIEQN